MRSDLKPRLPREKSSDDLRYQGAPTYYSLAHFRASARHVTVKEESDTSPVNSFKWNEFRDISSRG